MKTYLLLTVLLFSTCAKTQVNVANELVRYLYVGVDNPISISGLNIPEGQIVLKSDQGIITKDNRTKYSWKICSADKQYVYLKVYNKARLVDSIAFKVLPLPDPIIMTCNQDGELMFKGCQGVRADLKNFVIEGVQLEVKKFMILIVKTDGAVVRIENVRAYYGDAAKGAFAALKVGEKVTLSDFVVSVACETRTRKLATVLNSVYSGKEYEHRH